MGESILRRFRALLDVVATVLMILVSGALLWRLYQGPSRPSARPVVEDVSGLTIDSSRIAHSRGGGGVALIEFGDYECPFCARHKQTTAPLIHKRFVEAGKIQHIFLNFPLTDIHPRAPKAAEAAACAGRQGKFWEMHESLFANPKALNVVDLIERANALGLSEVPFVQCLDGSDTADQVQLDFEEGRRLGVNATPAFFIGIRQPDGSITLTKKVSGAAEFTVFEKEIQELLPEQRAQK